MNPRELYEKELCKAHDIQSTDEMYEAFFQNEYVEWVESQLTTTKQALKEAQEIIKVVSEDFWEEGGMCFYCNVWLYDDPVQHTKDCTHLKAKGLLNKLEEGL